MGVVCLRNAHISSGSTNTLQIVRMCKRWSRVLADRLRAVGVADEVLRGVENYTWDKREVQIRARTERWLDA